MLIEATPYTFGAMSLGIDIGCMHDEVRLVRRAMDAGISFRNGFDVGRTRC